MKKQGKRKLDQYKEYLKKRQKEKNNDENNISNLENQDNIKEKKKKTKKTKNNKKNNEKYIENNDLILAASKESCGLIEKIMTKEEKVQNDIITTSDNYEEKKSQNEDLINDDNKDKEKVNKLNENSDEKDEEKNNNNKNTSQSKEIKANENNIIDNKDNNNSNIDNNDNKDNNNSNIDNNDNKEEKNNNKDNFLLSCLYDLFEGYEEIIIKPINSSQYEINACLKVDDEKHIKFEIIYDKERDYFDYYPKNTNFIFENEDEPFNYDLEIPKEDFTLLIRNFKKFKIK